MLKKSYWLIILEICISTGDLKRVFMKMSHLISMFKIKAFLVFSHLLIRSKTFSWRALIKDILILLKEFNLKTIQILNWIIMVFKMKIKNLNFFLKVLKI
jgi:hypothetical protein